MATTKIIPNVLELNPGNPVNVLKATNAVTVSNASGANKYYFDGVYDGKFGLRIGTTVLTGVPSGHPIAIINNGKTSQISYTGTTSAGTGTGPDGNTYTFYYGDITITVSADFGTVSYYCQIHGYMGGQDNLVSVYSDAGLKMPSGTAFSGTPSEGMMRNDTGQESESSASTMQHYNGTDWKNFVNGPDITPFNASVLIVAGGGATAYSAGNGGGGGGGVLEGTLSLTPSTNYTLQVGAGGTISAVYGNPGNNGADSNFDMSASGGNTFTAVGGGKGGGCSICGSGTASGAGSSGGSGGGGGGSTNNASCNSGNCTGGTSSQTSISPLTGYGNSGGANISGFTGCYIGAGGGGAGGAGTSITSSTAGNGGSGHISTIITTTMATAGDGVNAIGEVVGSDVYYAAGGGGGVDSPCTVAGTGGLGGGGNGSLNSAAPTAGSPNTGGGGGGGGYVGTAGGSGVLIIKYPDSQTLTVSSSSGLTHTLDTSSISNFKVSMFTLSGSSNGTATINF